jgi:two-component system NarL family sensor kinase
LHDIETHVAGQKSVLRTVVDVRKLVDRTIGEIRTISRNLRPSELDDLGLTAAVRTLGAEFSTRTRIPIHFTLVEMPRPLSMQVELTIYRIIQEALTNVEKHAQASRVRVELGARDGHVVLRVVDNGTGLAEKKANSSRWGLINMQERASHVNGSFNVQFKPNKGTTIELRVPL